ncbi:VWA domain-containing protein [Calothrix sp. UHCC 0171]|uniref:vWA domain-containing protein n=1 Tax=Calothrix sp. UHCC 0171 TaxID=3110245 RepID=UPI002B213409|nr:VWA domain-containing protein [Calothrix sp. UHCC 0171]MEA5574198.1 VWA domain-containing protein [Calothrix sp. UHCC 0171]
MKITPKTIQILGFAILLGYYLGACVSKDIATTNTSGSQPSPTNQAPLQAQPGVAAKSESSKSVPKPVNKLQPTAPTTRVRTDVEENREQYSSFPENEFQAVSANPRSTFAIDVDTASYSNIRRFINEGQLPPVDAVRLEEMINYFKYDYPRLTDNKPFAVTTEVAPTPWNPQHRLVQVGLYSQNTPIEKLPANNLVFLIDVSGSMSDANKLPLLKSALRLMVNQLRPNDQVAIAVYAGQAGLVLPPTPGSQKQKIIDALEKLEAGGSTAGGEGIELAYQVARNNFLKSGNNRVILATDGDFNVGISSDEELVKLIEQQRQSGVFLSVLGLGTGNIQDGKMEKLANKGNGNYAYIDSLLEAKKVLVKELGATLFTIAKDVKIQVEFNPLKVQAYRLIGYENRLLQTQDFNDDKKDAGELGAGHTVTALYEIIPVGVKSNISLGKVDSLKYQNQTIAKSAIQNNEIMQVNLRYKQPQENTSQIVSYAVTDTETKLENASNNLKFASAIAMFGMLLRDSQYKGSTNFDTTLQLARESVGADLDGYRAEFIRLVEKSKNLKLSRN